MILSKKELIAFFNDNRIELDQWFDDRWENHPEPFYCSMDLRESDFKIASVDTNLFPGGFNNIHSDCHPRVIESLKLAVKAFCGDTDGVLLVAEKIDNNPYYYEHLFRLQELLVKAGIPTRITRVDIAENSTLDVTTASGRDLVLHSLNRRDNRLWSGTWSPCAVLLNDDLSNKEEGYTQKFHQIEQTILPLPALGWFRRRKSNHFRHYSAVVSDFCANFEIDRWILDPIFRVCEEIDIASSAGLDCVKKNCASVLAEIEQAYHLRNIDAKPSCFVKSDHGTHGLGIIHIDDSDQVSRLNRKQRKAMTYGKFGRPIERVIIQECVPSRQFNEKGEVSETVLYTIHHRVVGGFLRSHSKKNSYQSLNSPGMSFTPVSRSDIDNRFYHLQVGAKLSLLAAAREELEEVDTLSLRPRSVAENIIDSRLPPTGSLT